MTARLRIATRTSALALWQANDVKAKLAVLHPGLEVVLVPMISKGDKILDVPLAKVGGKGLFVKELETALLEDRADIAVHSMKDVPMEFPAGLGLPVICQREDPRDAFVSNDFNKLDDLPAGSIVGTSSLRRQSQLLARRPDLEIRFLRGNVGTRLSKLDAGDYQGIILAAAGLIRLGEKNRIKEYLLTDDSLPAGGQGAVGIECRTEDAAIQALIAPLHHSLSAQQVSAERAMNKRLEGGCQVPIGCFAVHQDGDLWLRGLVASADGTQVLRDQVRGPATQAEQLGIELAERLLAMGADKILAQVYAQS